MKLRTLFSILLGFLTVYVLAFALLNNRALMEERFILPGDRTLPIYGVVALVFLIGLSLAIFISLMQDSRSLFNRLRGWWLVRTGRAIDEQYKRGIEALLGGQDERALEAFDAVLAQNPGHFDALLISGDILRGLKRFEEGIGRHRRARRLRPRDLRPLYSLASDYEESKQYPKARLALGKIVELDPKKSVAALRRLRKIHMKEADWNGALHAQERIEAFTDKTPYKLEAERRYGLGIRYQIAVDLMKQEKHAEAIAQFGKVLKLAPAFVPALLRLGEAQREEGEVEAALETWHQAYRTTGSPIFLTAMENHFLEEEDPQVAIDTFRRLSAEAPRQVMPRFFLGKLFLRLEMIDEAHREFERLRERVAYSPALHYFLGKALARRREFAGAAAEFEQALDQLDLLRQQYGCSVCSARYRQWIDRCENCGEWSSVEIELREDRSLEEQGFPPSPVYSV
jgi:tetratricopeptide (TPR) repeat protein